LAARQRAILIVNKTQQTADSNHFIHRRVFAVFALLFGASIFLVLVLVLRSFPLSGGDTAVEIVAREGGAPDDVRVVLAGEPMEAALERRLLREISRRGAGSFEGLAADASTLLSAMASGRLESLWALYEGAGGEIDLSLADEFREFMRSLPARNRPDGWESWSDYAALLHVNRPMAKAWTSVALRRIAVVLPEDVERPSSAWPPLDQRAVGRGAPAWRFPMIDALLESGAPLVGVDVEYVDQDHGRVVRRFWFVRIGESSWFHAMTDTLVWRRVDDVDRRLF